MRAISSRELFFFVQSVVVSALLSGCGGGGGGGGGAPRPINGDTQAVHGSEDGIDAAFNAAGDGLAVWCSYSGSEYGATKVLCSRYSASQKRWAAEVELSTFGVHPRVAASATGFMVTWVSYDPGAEVGGVPYRGISCRSYDGRTWGPEVELVSGVDIGWSSSALGIVSDGLGYAVIWLQDSGSVDLHASTHSGGSWSAPEVLDAEVSEVRYPVLASSGSGSYAVAWEQSDGVANSIYASVYGGGGWTRTPLEVAGGDVSSPCIAASNLGYAVAWAQHDGFRNNIFANIYNGSSWQDPPALTPIEAGPGTADEPCIASNGAGYAVVWRQFDATLFTNILASVFDGISWSAEQYLEMADGDTRLPRIATNGSGYAAAWIQDDGENSPHASVYSSGAWSGPPAPLRSAAGSASNIMICRNGAGYAATWTQHETTRDLFGAAHDGSGWGSATLLEHSTSGANSEALVSRGATGCTAIWAQWDGERDNYFASQRGSDGWSAEWALAHGSHRAACEAPALVANAEGTALAVWQQHRSTEGYYSALAAYASVCRRGKWSAPFLIAETTDSPPALATDGTGFVVVWSQYEAGTGCSLYARIFDGTAWGDAAALECGPGTAKNPRVASNGSSYSVVWEQSDSGPIWNAYVNMYLTGSWTVPKLLEDSDHDAHDVVVAPYGTGYAAAWQQSDGAVDRIFAKNYSEILPAGSTVLAPTGENCREPRIASGDNGCAVTWQQEDGAGHVDIRANVFDPADGAWDPANTVVVDTLDGDAESPCIAASIGGRYMIAWAQEDGPTDGIYASLYDGAWSAPVNLDSSAAQAMYPRIASDGASYAVVWFTFDGTSAHTYYTRFDAGTWGAENALGDLLHTTAFPDVAAIHGVGYGAVYMQQDPADLTVWDIYAELGF